MKRTLVLQNRHRSGYTFLAREYLRYLKEKENIDLSYQSFDDEKLLRGIIDVKPITREDDREEGTDYAAIDLPENKTYLSFHDFWKKSIDPTLDATPEDFLTSIDFSLYDLSPAQIFLRTINRDYTHKILLCNGIPMNGKSFMHDMYQVTQALAQKYPYHAFICTKKMETPEYKNIFYTDKMNLENDLIEISYISQQCDMIIGKNSGPFRWCLTKENLQKPNKPIISFNKYADDCILNGLTVPARYEHSNVTGIGDIYNVIDERIIQ